MKRDDYCDTDDGHVDAKPEIRQKSPLIRTVIACITVSIIEEQGPKERRNTEDRLAVMFSHMDRARNRVIEVTTGKCWICLLFISWSRHYRG